MNNLLSAGNTNGTSTNDANSYINV